jgi:hypothetical protein
MSAVFWIGLKGESPLNRLILLLMVPRANKIYCFWCAIHWWITFFTADITKDESKGITHVWLCNNDGRHSQHAWTRLAYAGNLQLLWTLQLLPCIVCWQFLYAEIVISVAVWIGANSWCPGAWFVLRSSSKLLHDVDTPTICGWNSGG